MKTTANLLTVVLAWTLVPTSFALAGSSCFTSHAAIAAWTVAQSEPAGDADVRNQADQWLAQARTAMNNGDLELAEYYIGRAETLNANYDTIFARFQDSPDRARKDLAALRQKAQPGGSPAASRQAVAAAPPADPFAAKTTALAQAEREPGAAAEEPRRLPATTNASQLPSFSLSSFDPQGAGAGDVQAQSNSLLLAARRALARRDLPAAAQLAAQAKSLGAQYQLHEDSPAKVEALITKAKLMLTAGPHPDAAEHSRQTVQLLMEQADGLLQYQDLDNAERLALEAKGLPAELGSFARTPDQILTDIADQRRSLAAASGVAPAEGGVAQGAAPTQAKAQALKLVAMGRMALDRGQLQKALQLAQQAQDLDVPETAFAPDDTRPWQLLLEVNRAMNRRPSAVVPAVGFNLVSEGDGPAAARGALQQGVYTPAEDLSRNVLAASQQPSPAAAEVSPARRLYQDGLRALEQRDRTAALNCFQQAWRQREQLDPATLQELQDKLTLLQTPLQPAAAPREPSPLEQVDSRQQVLYQKLLREVTAEQTEAQKASAADPLAALSQLQRLRDRVGEAELDPMARKQLLTMVDRSINDLQQYIESNRSQIELNQHNRETQEGIELSQQKTIEVQSKIAELVDQFNTLIDEQRFAEAEVLAKQARELDPDSPVVQSLIWKSRFVRRIKEQLAIDDGKEQGFYDAATSVLASSAPFDDRTPFVLPDAKFWNDLSDRRGKLLQQRNSRLTPAELEIQQSLKKPVEVRFSDRPLSEVMDALGAMSDVNIYLDPQGMAAEGVTSDTPVTINLTQPISLQSALNLVLEPLRLSYVIQNEVLRVTSEQTRDSDVFTKVYNVADLVIPIPNFIPGYNVGLPAAIREAHNAVGYGATNRPMGAAPLTIASNEIDGGVADNQSVLAQMGASGILPNNSGTRPPHQMGYGPGGLGGAALADFDTLINLIETTVKPETWDAVGGPGAIEPFPTNLSLVISQTQEVHDEISDLLDQLRRLQDLQVTIEVRFITLNDSFFERIGVDFDFSITDGLTQPIINSGTTRYTNDEVGNSVTIGLDPEGAPTANLNLDFTQGSLGSTVPQFGGFDVGSAANFGFAILSDIEVFFLLEAAEGDSRSNILQAPKVTLFNGQQASVLDQSQRPFVTSIIPVVGDFAAAHQPVIVVLSEGTSLSVQAVVSSDRRFVRLTLVPFFSQIGNVQEFTFSGRTTTNTGSNVIDPDGKPSGAVDNRESVTEGTTVQLPTFVFTTVSTTVSVPDGGTVLLGGIKRLSESRSERGVPMLNKLPYVSRLFKNVGIGRDTTSLMMMVTPRIIIQEEEEFLQTGYDSTAP